MGLPIKSGGVPSITLAGVTFPFDPVNNSNHVVFYCGSDSTTPNLTLRKIGASSGYQVPAGKTLYIVGVRMTNQAAQLLVFKPLYSDNDMGMHTSTAPTNPVYPVSGSSADELGIGVSTIGSVFEAAGILHIVPTGKYPGHIGPGGTSAYQGLAYGILV